MVIVPQLLSIHSVNIVSRIQVYVEPQTHRCSLQVSFFVLFFDPLITV